jgi:hypothetical protein
LTSSHIENFDLDGTVTESTNTNESRVFILCKMLIEALTDSTASAAKAVCLFDIIVLLTAHLGLSVDSALLAGTVVQLTGTDRT